jgi:hypothetical protein
MTIDQYFQKTRLMHPHYIHSPGEQDNESTRAKRKRSSTLSDNM